MASFKSVTVICNGKHTHVEDADGTRLENVTAISFQHSTGYPPQVEITFSPQLILFDGSVYDVNTITPPSVNAGKGAHVQKPGANLP